MRRGLINYSFSYLLAFFYQLKDLRNWKTRLVFIFAPYTLHILFILIYLYNLQLNKSIHINIIYCVPHSSAIHSLWVAVEWSSNAVSSAYELFIDCTQFFRDTSGYCWVGDQTVERAAFSQDSDIIDRYMYSSI